MVSIMDKLIILLSENYIKDEIGQEICNPIKKEVFAEEKSITQREFFNAGHRGLKPARVFKIWFFEYEGETEILYEEKRYFIYRTYKKGDKIELYCEERVSGKKEQ